MQSTPSVRPLRFADVAAAFELSAAAGWNQTADDWRMLLELAPRGCFGIDSDGKLVASTTLLPYGQRLAWIGMVLTHPSYRHRGFARTLLAHTLATADSLGIKTLKLDATDQGQPLYAKLGFRAEGTIERWSRPGSANLPVNAGESHSDLALAPDLVAFGADRSTMLARLATRSQVHIAPDAYLLVRTGRTTAYLGPCVASDAKSARKLITSTLGASFSDALSWDLLPKNANAIALASELGFIRQRVLTRMGRGQPLHGRDDMIYAIAGFELG
jgi:GNAT superfamily N-acetyltransferase